MAVSFYTPQFTGDTCYTSQLQIYYSGNGRTLIFETDYYTHQSRATVYDLGTLIETHMQQDSSTLLSEGGYLERPINTMMRKQIKYNGLNNYKTTHFVLNVFWGRLRRPLLSYILPNHDSLNIKCKKCLHM